MSSEDKQKQSPAAKRGQRAESMLAEMFEHARWGVERQPQVDEGAADMIVRNGKGVVYVVEVKAGVEGRSDRLVPLFAQAVLEASRAARNKAKPLAVVAAPKINERAAHQVLNFAAQYAPNVAAGVMDFEGLRLFRGPNLEALNAQSEQPSLKAAKSPRVSGHLFSDLNQWMLKVLLAPEIPNHLLSSPRAQYKNASQLASAAEVSMMSAFRFVQLLQDEGYLSEFERFLRLVRREELFRRWQAAAVRSVKEMRMKYLLKGDPRAQLRKVLASGRACLALFAAADALKLGFVEGVPAYVYVERLQQSSFSALKNLRQCESGERPDLILRQAPVPQSVFRGLVHSNGIAVCDVLQIWVDVASHPSRGREQADLIRKRVLEAVIKGNR
jgi:hypothetical protein